LIFQPESQNSVRTLQNAVQYFENPIGDCENADQNFEILIEICHFPIGILKVCLTFLIFR
jgi:hypothetical protein